MGYISYLIFSSVLGQEVIYKADDINDSNSGYDQYDNTTQHSF